MDPENLRHLKKNACMVWLEADPAVIRERMSRTCGRGDLRPSLVGPDPIEEIEALLAQRTPQYEKACHLRVRTDGLTPEGVVRQIMKAMWDGAPVRKERRY